MESIARLKDCVCVRARKETDMYAQRKLKIHIKRRRDRVSENGKMRRKPANNNNNKFVYIQVDVLLVIDCYLRTYILFWAFACNAVTGIRM